MSIETLKIPFKGEFIKEGDTILETVLDITNAGDLTTATIKMQIYNGSIKLIDISNGNGITVNSATQLTIDEVPFANNNFRKGKYLGDFEVTDVNGVRKTYFNVEYTIIENYTK